MVALPAVDSNDESYPGVEAGNIYRFGDLTCCRVPWASTEQHCA